MKNNRDVDYFYKSCDLSNMDDLNKKRYEYMNDYGYNIDCNSKKVMNESKAYAKTKRFVNSNYNDGKR